MGELLMVVEVRFCVNTEYFGTQSLMAFLSPAPDNGDGSQRVLGDFQQMVTVGNKFYGVVTGTGAWFGRTGVSNDPIVFYRRCEQPHGGTPNAACGASVLNTQDRTETISDQAARGRQPVVVRTDEVALMRSGSQGSQSKID
jgi:hypothetical protein